MKRRKALVWVLAVTAVFGLLLLFVYIMMPRVAGSLIGRIANACGVHAIYHQHRLGDRVTYPIILRIMRKKYGVEERDGPGCEAESWGVRYYYAYNPTTMNWAESVYGKSLWDIETLAEDEALLEGYGRGEFYYARICEREICRASFVAIGHADDDESKKDQIIVKVARLIESESQRIKEFTFSAKACPDFSSYPSKADWVFLCTTRGKWYCFPLSAYEAWRSRFIAVSAPTTTQGTDGR